VVSGTNVSLILLVKEGGGLQSWGKFPQERKYPCLSQEHSSFLHALGELTGELFDKPPV